ncbi:hypothetical protein CTS44_05626 [Comamonas thiooxydans]|nr:hypothetical protein CTS44_05626 [Comamonas thiooxydans]
MNLTVPRKALKRFKAFAVLLSRMMQAMVLSGKDAVVQVRLGFERMPS